MSVTQVYMSETYLKTQQPSVSIPEGVTPPKAYVLRDVKRKRHSGKARPADIHSNMSVKLIFILCLPEKFTGPETRHIFIIAYLKLRNYFLQ